METEKSRQAVRETLSEVELRQSQLQELYGITVNIISSMVVVGVGGGGRRPVKAGTGRNVLSN